MVSRQSRDNKREKQKWLSKGIWVDSWDREPEGAGAGGYRKVRMGRIRVRFTDNLMSSASMRW